jgi:hypothetical protein
MPKWSFMLPTKSQSGPSSDSLAAIIQTAGVYPRDAQAMILGRNIQRLCTSTGCAEAFITQGSGGTQ